MLLMGIILGASWACENLDLGILPVCHEEAVWRIWQPSHIYTHYQDRGERASLLTTLLKIVCKVHKKGTLAVTGQASRDGGALSGCRLLSGLGQALRCNCMWEKRDSFVDGINFVKQDVLNHSCGHALMQNRKANGYVYTAHRHVQHSPPHDSITAKSPEPAVCPRRANAEGHPSPHQRSWIYLWAQTSHSRFLPSLRPRWH